MNREQIVELGNKSIANKLSALDVTNFLQEYCKDKANEMSKPLTDTEYNAIDQCISLVISANQWQRYFQQALSYYNQKYSVVECYSTEFTIKTPLGEQKQRKLLMYY